MDIPSLFNHFLTHGHLSCFKYFQVTNIATMNNFMHVYFHIGGGVSESIPRKGSAESDVNVYLYREM